MEMLSIQIDWHPSVGKRVYSGHPRAIRNLSINGNRLRTGGTTTATTEVCLVCRIETRKWIGCDALLMCVWGAQPNKTIYAPFQCVWLDTAYTIWWWTRVDRLCGSTEFTSQPTLNNIYTPNSAIGVGIPQNISWLKNSKLNELLWLLHHQMNVIHC